MGLADSVPGTVLAGRLQGRVRKMRPVDLRHRLRAETAGLVAQVGRPRWTAGLADLLGWAGALVDPDDGTKCSTQNLLLS